MASIKTQKKSVLFIGYGNPGRRDDGLGPALAKRLDKLNLPHVDIDSDYQLNFEHAYDIAAYNIIIFADAAVAENKQGTLPFYFREIEGGNPASFTTHSVTPEAVIRLGQELFQAENRAFLLAITGFEFEEIAEGLTERAITNLDQAEAFIKIQLEKYR